MPEMNHRCVLLAGLICRAGSWQTGSTSTRTPRGRAWRPLTHGSASAGSRQWPCAWRSRICTSTWPAAARALVRALLSWVNSGMTVMCMITNTIAMAMSYG
eukprot:scaffold164277_cov18-Prasinocladus_malaysianus.AAC.1